MNHMAKAEELFMSGYNCAQSVLLAYKEEIGIDEGDLMRMSSSLGGGMGGLREMCGAISSMFLVMGYLYGPGDPSDKQAKAAHYARLQAMAHQFAQATGSLRCSELLAGLKGGIPPAPSARSEAYYKERPCARLVGYAARLIDEYMQAQEDEQP